MTTKNLDFTISIKGTIKYKDTPVKDLFAFKRTMNINGLKEVVQGLATQKDLKELATLKKN